MISAKALTEHSEQSTCPYSRHLGQVVPVPKTGLRGDCDFVKRVFSRPYFKVQEHETESKAFSPQGGKILTAIKDAENGYLVSIHLERDHNAFSVAGYS